MRTGVAIIRIESAFNSVCRWVYMRSKSVERSDVEKVDSVCRWVYMHSKSVERTDVKKSDSTGSYLF